MYNYIQMGISKQPPKPFPIKKGIPCQLKWGQSTVYLTDGVSASCHRVQGDPLEMRNGELNFHNLPAKLEARRKMLKGEWPGRGCQHCQHIEEAGGTSDRQIHLNLEGYTAPPELDNDLEAVDVTPRNLEVYWGNTCNQKCIYCAAHFSSQIHQEEKRFGLFDKEGVTLDYNDFKLNPNIERDTERLFAWLENNIQKLHKIMVMGGEPFLQKETFRFIQFLEKRELPDLTLVFFSNHNVEHDRYKMWVRRLDKMVKQGRLDKLQIIASCDAWGPAGEYVRTGIDLPLLQKNFEYVLNETETLQGINSALTVTAVPGMPEMVKMINKWSKIRPVYWSMMKAAQHDVGSKSYLYPGIFGRKINDIGLGEAIDLFDIKSYGSLDSVKANHKIYMRGIMNEFEKREPSIRRQKQFKIYLKELDRRRGTDYTKVYPQIAEWLKEL
jgi:wyosine [tRNA(Phe)-imidazoG37] synthetase (radical SAM superfamily)